MTFSIHSLNTIKQTAQSLLAYCKGHSVFAFYGEMGVGKTTLIKAMCEELGVSDFTNSPSFAIVNEYQTTEGKTIYHFDFYRINTPHEALDMGYEDYIYSGYICLIEWPEKITTLLPNDFVKVLITENEDGTRTLKIQLPE
jgi:tRNA threonylcarbamoyladenosine biosynthesis protein TsaE